jgi:hypothetical protein
MVIVGTADVGMRAGWAVILDVAGTPNGLAVEPVV